MLFILLSLFFQQILKSEIKVPIGIYLNISSVLNMEYSIGLNSCFKEYNTQENKKFELILHEYNNHDDTDSSRKLIYLDKVVALLGYSDSSSIDKANGMQIVPIIFPFNNDKKFRTFSNIFTIRPTLEQELELLSKNLANSDKISIIYLDSLENQKDYIKSKLQGKKIVSESSYTNNPLKLNEALLTTKKAKPDTVIFLGDPDSGLSFAKRVVRTTLKNVTFVSTSNVINTHFLKNLNEYKLRIISTSIFKDENNELKREYSKALRKFYSSKASNEALEAYLVGRVLIKVIEEIISNNEELSRENLISNLSKRKEIEISGIKLIREERNFKIPLYLNII